MKLNQIENKIESEKNKQRGRFFKVELKLDNLITRLEWKNINEKEQITKIESKLTQMEKKLKKTNEVSKPIKKDFDLFLIEKNKKIENEVN